MGALGRRRPASDGGAEDEVDEQAQEHGLALDLGEGHDHEEVEPVLEEVVEVEGGSLEGGAHGVALHPGEGLGDGGLNGAALALAGAQDGGGGLGGAAAHGVGVPSPNLEGLVEVGRQEEVGHHGQGAARGFLLGHHNLERGGHELAGHGGEVRPVAALGAHEPIGDELEVLGEMPGPDEVEGVEAGRGRLDDAEGVEDRDLAAERQPVAPRDGEVLALDVETDHGAAVIEDRRDHGGDALAAAGARDHRVVAAAPAPGVGGVAQHVAAPLGERQAGLVAREAGDVLGRHPARAPGAALGGAVAAGGPQRPDGAQGHAEGAQEGGAAHHEGYGVLLAPDEARAMELLERLPQRPREGPAGALERAERHPGPPQRLLEGLQSDEGGPEEGKAPQSPPGPPMALCGVSQGPERHREACERKGEAGARVQWQAQEGGEEGPQRRNRERQGEHPSVAGLESEGHRLSPPRAATGRGWSGRPRRSWCPRLVRQRHRPPPLRLSRPPPWGTAAPRALGRGPSP